MTCWCLCAHPIYSKCYFDSTCYQIEFYHFNSSYLKWEQFIFDFLSVCVAEMHSKKKPIAKCYSVGLKWNLLDSIQMWILSENWKIRNLSPTNENTIEYNLIQFEQYLLMLVLFMIDCFVLFGWQFYVVWRHSNVWVG